MTALTAERDTLTVNKPGLKGHRVAADAVIWQGGMVCLNDDGFLVPASDLPSLSAAKGIAQESYDNTGGANGDRKIRVRSGELYNFEATSITDDMVGRTMYVVDDQTFDETENDVVAGVLMEVLSVTNGLIYIPTENVARHRQDIIAGQDETGDTTIPLAAIGVADEILSFFVQDGTSGLLTQRANSDFSITAGVINVDANAVNNAANFYVVNWRDN